MVMRRVVVKEVAVGHRKTTEGRKENREKPQENHQRCRAELVPSTQTRADRRSGSLPTLITLHHQLPNRFIPVQGLHAVLSGRAAGGRGSLQNSRAPHLIPFTSLTCHLSPILPKLPLISCSDCWKQWSRLISLQ